MCKQKGKIMKEIIIGKDSSGQRIDRYLKKYLDQATLSFIYKMLRKKNITINGKKVSEEYMLADGDVLRLFLSDETIEKFQKPEEKKRARTNLDVVYEDDNILVINKPVGLLSHSTGRGEFEKNVVDSMIEYLIEKKDYIPRLSPTFTPSISNRLDRNTSGLVIGAKNYNALKMLNKAMRERNISKYYYTIVSGVVKGERNERAQLSKIESRRNKVTINTGEDREKEIQTIFKGLGGNSQFTLLEIDLVTGRTHQIRAHLAHLRYPVIGDRKYGDSVVNNYFRQKYNLEDQLLHCGKIVLDGLEGDLAYLNEKVITAPMPAIMDRIIKGELDDKIQI